MSSRTMLACDGQGCAMVFVGLVGSAREVRRLAAAEGWSSRHIGGRVLDACRIHTDRITEDAQ